jgi:hypothetical protein
MVTSKQSINNSVPTLPVSQVQLRSGTRHSIAKATNQKQEDNDVEPRLERLADMLVLFLKASPDKQVTTRRGAAYMTCRAWRLACVSAVSCVVTCAR